METVSVYRYLEFYTQHQNESEVAAVIEDQFYGMFRHFHIKSRSGGNAGAVIKPQRRLIKYKKHEIGRV